MCPSPWQVCSPFAYARVRKPPHAFRPDRSTLSGETPQACETRAFLSLCRWTLRPSKAGFRTGTPQLNCRPNENGRLGLPSDSPLLERESVQPGCKQPAGKKLEKGETGCRYAMNLRGAQWPFNSDSNNPVCQNRFSAAGPRGFPRLSILSAVSSRFVGAPRSHKPRKAISRGKCLEA